MGACSRRRFFQAVCILQILTSSFRQAFDFLGYMWTPILTNFFNIIFAIFGFFGAYQYRPQYVVTYCIWSLMCVGWNIFVICFYLELGVLDKDGDALNMGTGSASWWEVNGYGCRASYPANLTGEDIMKPLRPERVSGCLLRYETVEILQAAIQVLLALVGGLTGIWVTKAMLDEDDSSLPASKSRAASLYSIEYSQDRPRSATPDRVAAASSTRGVAVSSLARHSHNRNSYLHHPPHSSTLGLDLREYGEEGEEEDDEDMEGGLGGGSHRVKPMTPRRVKRRSTSRGSTRSRHGHQGGVSASQQQLPQPQLPPQHSNPVSRLLDQQERRLVGHSNPTYQSSSNQSLDRPASSYSNYHGQRQVTLRAAGQVPPSNRSQVPANSLRHSYRRHMHQAPPPYNGHYGSSHYDSETVI